MRRTVVALLAVVAVLGGCAGGGGENATPAAVAASPTPSLTAADVREVVRRGRAADPYAAHVSNTVYVDGGRYQSLIGELNLNATITGRVQLSRTDDDGKQQALDVVVTMEASWMRETGTTAWRRFRREQADIDNIGSMPGYADALLDTGQDVLKGRELTESGVDAIRLSGSLTADQVRPVERQTYDMMRSTGVEKIDCDIWLDDQGRVVKFELLSTADDVPTRAVTLVGDFRAPISVSPPT